MRNAPGQPAAVLDYATTTPRDALVKRIRAVITVLWCMLLGLTVGWLLDPREYRAVGYLEVSPIRVLADATEQPLTVDDIVAGQVKIASGITSAANVNTALASLPPANALSASEAATVSADMKVQAVAQSRLVAVSYEHRAPTTAAAVVNAAVRSYATPGVTIVAWATPPARPQQDRLFPTAGLAIGLLFGVFIVALRK